MQAKQLKRTKLFWSFQLFSEIKTNFGNFLIAWRCFDSVLQLSGATDSSFQLTFWQTIPQGRVKKRNFVKNTKILFEKWLSRFVIHDFWKRFLVSIWFHARLMLFRVGLLFPFEHNSNKTDSDDEKQIHLGKSPTLQSLSKYFNEFDYRVRETRTPIQMVIHYILINWHLIR